MPRLFAYVIRTCRRLRNDFSTTSCGSGSTTSTLPSSSSALRSVDRVARLRLVERDVAHDRELAALQRVGQRRAQRAALHLLVHAHLVASAGAGRARRRRRPTVASGSSPDGRGRCPSGATASCRRPRRRRGSWSSACRRGCRRGPPSTTWCISGTLTVDSNTSAGRSRDPTFLPCDVAELDRGHQAPFPAVAGALTAERTMTSPPFGTGDGALDQEQVALGVGLRRPRGSGP